MEFSPFLSPKFPFSLFPLPFYITHQEVLIFQHQNSKIFAWDPILQDNKKKESEMLIQMVLKSLCKLERKEALNFFSYPFFTALHILALKSLSLSLPLSLSLSLSHTHKISSYPFQEHILNLLMSLFCLNFYSVIHYVKKIEANSFSSQNLIVSNIQLVTAPNCYYASLQGTTYLKQLWRILSIHSTI